MKTIYGLALAAAFGLFAGQVARADGHGPHKGEVVEWGEEEYHLEVVPDAKGGAVTVYVYGSHGDLDKGVAKAIDSKTLTLTLKGAKPAAVKLEPKPAAGDAAGKSSVFVGKSPAIPAGGHLSGSVSGKVGTKPYTGDFGH